MLPETIIELSSLSMKIEFVFQRVELIKTFKLDQWDESAVT